MLTTLLLILILLWFLGYVHIGYINLPNIILFSINGRTITLWDLLILIVVAWALSILPGPLRIVGGVLLVLWILSVLGIIALAGISLPSLLVIAIIVGFIVSLLSPTL